MKNLVLSVDKLNDLSICPRLYFFKHILRRTPEVRPKYFIEGEFFHALLHEYYSDKIEGKSRPYIELAQNKAAEFSDLSIDESNELISLFSKYLNFYTNDPWKPLESEKPFARVLLEDTKLDLRLVIRGRADLVVDTGQFKAVVDHKLLAMNQENIERDNQKLAYCWAFELKDFFLNVIGKQKSLPIDKKLHRLYSNYSKHQIEEWKDQTIIAAMELIRYFETDNFPARYTGCNFHRRKCTYYDICNTTPDNWEYKLQTGFTEREEYDVMEGVDQ